MRNPCQARVDDSGARYSVCDVSTIRSQWLLCRRVRLLECNAALLLYCPLPGLCDAGSWQAFVYLYK